MISPTTGHDHHRRPYSGQSDQLRMSALAHASPDDNLHVVDLPYRLSSWAFDDPANAGLWFDESGELVAWAVLQTPFWAIDYTLHPAARHLHPEVLAWADARAREALPTPSGRPAWFVAVFEDQAGLIRDLEAAGFNCQANVPHDPWSQVWMARPAQAPVPEAALPPGFVIRPLADEGEVDACVALHRSVFGSLNMTREWRARTLRRPEYRPELDLVAVAPGGRLAAFCVCWFDLHGPGGRPAGQIEPLGVGQEFRRLGLGRAILAEGIRRLHRLGVEQVLVETDNFRDAAFALYRSSGFRVARNVLMFRRDYAA